VAEQDSKARLLRLIRSRPGLTKNEVAKAALGAGIVTAEFDAVEMVDALARDGEIANGDGHWVAAGAVVVDLFPEPKRQRTTEQKLMALLNERKATHAHFRVLMLSTQFLDWETMETYVSLTRLARECGCKWDTAKAAFDWAYEQGIIVSKRKAPGYRDGDKRMAYTFDGALVSDFSKRRKPS
jgi:hypothetical protein